MDAKNSDPNANEWVGRLLSGIAPPEGWEPDVEGALNSIRVRRRQHASKKQAWAWAAVVAAAACLVLVALPPTRAAASLAWERLATRLVPPEQSAAVQAAAVFDENERLRYPSGYRNWVYVGTSLGLRYTDAAGVDGGQDEGPQQAAGTRQERFQNVYIDPQAYAVYSETGEFPEGTVMVLEVASSQVRDELGLEGRFEKEILGIEASVKDSRRFDGGWAYFSFTGRGEEVREVAEAFPSQSCWACHDAHAETDHVFTQFYPIL